MAKNQDRSSTIWRLRRGMDRRFRSGHPWVYSNELVDSPKGIEPGELIELRDSEGKFLARGFGNPKSLISFRCLTRIQSELTPDSVESLTHILIRSGKLRWRTGFGHASYRLCFGEADGVPGLVIDRYAIRGGQVFVAQAHSAGADRILKHLEQALETYTRSFYSEALWNQTSILVRNDLSVRKLEGLEEEGPRPVKLAQNVNLKDVDIEVRSVLKDDLISFKVDLLEGQKTGFFLDQFANVQLAALRFKDLSFSDGKSGQRIRILDLCSYVGQWGTQLSKVFKSQGNEVEVLAVDASAQALEFAKRNIESQGGHCDVLKANVLKDLGALQDKSFDIVISDPPALIKSRKDIPAGTHAYLQLATQAFRLVKKGGGIVACSCSALLEEESFTHVLGKAAQRNSAQIRWIGRGTQSPDHPILVEFPEGRYLKGWVGVSLD